MKFYVFIFLTLLVHQVFAAEAAVECKAKSYSELVRCVDQSSSEILLAELRLKSAEKLEGVASQWINPELDAETVQHNSEKSETSAALLFTLRLGGKKGALVKEAESEKEKAFVQNDLTRHQVRLEFMLSLYRLAHLKSEIKIEEESVQTYTKIANQYQRRASLSPEQDVSLSVFRMALADHQFRLIKLKSEEEKIYQLLLAGTGLSKEIITANLPARKDNWPALSNAVVDEQSPAIRQAKADLNFAKSQKEKADSEAWPDVKLGPAFKQVRENNETSTFYGVGLSMPLPVFNLNGNDRSYKALKLAETEMQLNQVKKKVIAERTERLSKYNQTVQQLKNALSLKFINEKHDQLEKQFFKGLVSSSLVIEAHRQLFDFEERRNSAEADALEALGQILIVDNQFDGVVL